MLEIEVKRQSRRELEAGAGGSWWPGNGGLEGGEVCEMWACVSAVACFELVAYIRLDSSELVFVFRLDVCNEVPGNQYAITNMP